MEPRAVSDARWLLDSNAVMGYLNQEPAPGFTATIERCFAEGAAVPIITLIEVLGWPGHDARSRADAEQLLRGLALIELSPPAGSGGCTRRQSVARWNACAAASRPVLVDVYWIHTCTSNDHETV
jgi:hypothetical protein